MLSAHGGEETDAAHARTKSPLETPAGAHEIVPCGTGVFARRGGVLRRLEGKNHADGPATMRQDVRGSRFSHMTHDAGGMSLQFADSDDLLPRSGPSDWVVPHVTTLRVCLVGVKDARAHSRRGFCLRLGSAVGFATSSTV